MLNNYCPTCKVLCGEKFCWKCGEKSVPGMLECPHCKEQVSVIGKFCGYCGKPIQEAIKEHILRELEGERGGENADNNTGDKDN